MKKRLASLSTLFLCLASSLILLSSFVEGDESSGSGEAAGGGDNALFQKTQDTKVKCKDTSWEKTEFYDSWGSLVGTTLYEAGVLQHEYTGSYSSSKTTSGGREAFEAMKTTCYSTCFWCGCIASDPCDE